MSNTFKHKHHIIPKHMGGTDDESNLVEITRDEHCVEHLKLYYTFGKKQDLCAYYMIRGDIELFRSELGKLGGKTCQEKRKIQNLTSFGLDPKGQRHKEIAKKGGHVQGKRNAESGHMKKIQRMADCSAAGKKGSATCKAQKKNAFFDPILKKEIVKKGGHVQGKRNAESGHLKRISKLSKRNTGMIWITNGKERKMITKQEQIPQEWMKGMYVKTKANG